MNDDWLDTGHGDDPVLPAVFTRSAASPGPRADRPVGRTPRRAGSASAIILAAAVLLGSTGTAFAIRESLFPSLGAPTSRSVWQNPAPEPDDDASTNSNAGTTAPTTALDITLPPTTAVAAAAVTAPGTTLAPRGGVTVTTLSERDSDRSGSDDAAPHESGADDAVNGSGTGSSGGTSSDDPSADDRSDDASGSDRSGSGSGGSGSGGSDSGSSGSGSGGSDSLDDASDD